ncbi:hypothetical protein DPMN_098601 [Dreissena polymorpha]|uniref:Uncharacterized protein n=1 Tax=Dreissena polymorpha TaxID=45954 RepID=A0A9D4R5M6_DREPO|nr:hypothetical protein DPMN_098601 [Dreissena polymorpha]
MVRVARKRNPYVLVPMKYYDCLGIKDLVISVLPPNVVNIGECGRAGWLAGGLAGWQAGWRAGGTSLSGP